MCIIKISQNQYNISEKYMNDLGESKTSSKYYEECRNQPDTSKNNLDHFYGKIAEFAVYNYLSNKFDISLPDVEIYSAKNKSYDSDLIITKNNGDEILIHVKSQHTNRVNRYGKSWMFQQRDKLITNPKDNDVIILCSIIDSKTIEIMNYFKAKDLTKFYRDPMKKELIGLIDPKTCLYYDDLI